MLSSHAFLSLILVALTAVGATPVSRTTGKTTLSFAAKINQHGGGNIVERDRDRILAMKFKAGQRGERSMSFSIQNANFYYTAQVGVGSPLAEYTLLIDTGSSNTWVGADKRYVQTNTSHDTGHAVSVRYGSGSFSGEEWTDTVTLAPGLVIEQQSIGVANQSSGFFGIDGILGVGPVDLTRGSVSGVDVVPTVSDNLLSQGKISEEVLGVYFMPAAEGDKSGELTFGGIDYRVITSPVLYVPLTTTFPASFFWGINQTVIYGDTILLSDAGIVDTGSTLIYLASDAFQKYQNMTGATMDTNTGLLRITPEQYEDLQNLTFFIGYVPFVLTRNAQIWPRSLNALIGGDPDGIYLVIAGLQWQSGSGFDFVNGYAFLERYYSVYDATNSRVGFAFTKYTFSNDN